MDSAGARLAKEFSMRCTMNPVLTVVFLATVLANGFPLRGVTVTVPTTLTAPGTYNKLTFTVHADTPVGSPSSTRILDMTGGFTANLNVDFNSATRAPTVSSLRFQEDTSGNIHIDNNDSRGNFDLKWTILFWSYHEYVGMDGIRATPLSPSGYSPVSGTSFDMSSHQVKMNSGTISWWGDFAEDSWDCGLNPITITPPAGTSGTLEVAKRAGYDTWTSSSYSVHILAPISFADMPVTSGSVPILGDYTVTDSGSGTVESNGTFTRSFTPTAGYWDTGAAAGLQAGNGTWSASAANWSPLAGGGDPPLGWYSGGSSLDVYFNTSGSSIVTLGSNISAKSLTFNGAGYEIAGSGSYTLSLVSGNLTTNQNAIVSAPLAGSYSLTKNGTANLTLSGSSSNTYSGLTMVNNGTLLLAKTGSARAIAGGALMVGDNVNTVLVQYTGTSSDMMGTGTVTINRNGTLDFNGKTDTIGNVVLYGNSTNIGRISNTAGGGALTVGELSFYGGGAAASGSGKVVLGGNVSYATATNGVAAEISGNVDLNASRTFTVADDAALGSELTVSAVVADGSGGNNGLIKEGLGKLALTGGNTFTGSVLISGGTLALAGGGQLSTSLVNNAVFEVADGTANRTVGAITGSGTTQIRADGHLLTPTISQASLIIGGAREMPRAQPVPEPSVFLLLGTAGLGFLWAIKTRK